jgi:hypothetical protein
MAIASVTGYRTNFLETLPVSDTGVKIWLNANTELTWTVPGDSSQQFRANFRYASTAEIWVGLNKTVVVPVAGTAIATYNEELLPEHKYVSGGDVLHFISTGTPQIGVSLLSLPGK